MASSVADFAADAAAGVDFLAGLEEVSAIGIIGHSEGGLSGPMVATTSDQLDFLVLLAPPGERLDLLVQRQVRDLRRAQGIDEGLIERADEGQDEQFALLKDASLPREEVERRILEQVAEWKTRFNDAELDALGYDENLLKQNLMVSTSNWFRSLMREDPATYLEQTTIPVLALLPARDVQVVASVNAPLIEAALEKAGNKDFEVRILGGLNHLFQHSETGAMSEYGMIEETFAPEALELIGDWIENRHGR